MNATNYTVHLFCLPLYSLYRAPHWTLAFECQDLERARAVLELHLRPGAVRIIKAEIRQGERVVLAC